jgi:hypothetical protein
MQGELFHSEFLHEKGPLVGGGLNAHLGRFARAVTGLGFDANEDRILSPVGLLESC